MEHALNVERSASPITDSSRSDKSEDYCVENLRSNMELKIFRECENAKLPTRGTEYAAGLDLYCSKDTVLPPWTDDVSKNGGGLQPVRVSTGIRIELPVGTYGRLTGRSGATMRKMFVLAGVIDSDYRGPIEAMVVNLSAQEIVIRAGERIAQLLVEKYVFTDIVEVASFVDLNQTVRGEKGFGSTGYA